MLAQEKIDHVEIIAIAKRASQTIGLREFTAQAAVDPAIFNKTLAGKRQPSLETLAKRQQSSMNNSD